MDKKVEVKTEEATVTEQRVKENAAKLKSPRTKRTIKLKNLKVKTIGQKLSSLPKMPTLKKSFLVPVLAILVMCALVPLILEGAQVVELLRVEKAVPLKAGHYFTIDGMSSVVTGVEDGVVKIQQTSPKKKWWRKTRWVETEVDSYHLKKRITTEGVELHHPSE